MSKAPPPPGGPKGPPPGGPPPSATKPAPKALLGSIEGFKKGGLKKAVTNDRSSPILKTEKTPPGGGMPMPGGGMPKGKPAAGGGGAPPGGMFAGGMPALKPGGAKPAGAGGRPTGHVNPAPVAQPKTSTPGAGGRPTGPVTPVGAKPQPASAPADAKKPAPAVAAKAPAPAPKGKPPAPAARGSVATAKYAYDAQRDDELSFVVGDHITVLKKNANGWWEGSLNGATGVFPSNYVELIN